MFISIYHKKGISVSLIRVKQIYQTNYTCFRGEKNEIPSNIIVKNWKLALEGEQIFKINPLQ